MSQVNHKRLIAVLQQFTARKSYVSLRAKCMKAATSWRWATGSMLLRLPHEEQIYGNSAPKWVTKQPESGVLHGVDKNGRILVMRSDSQCVPDENVEESFLVHESDGFWRIEFEAEKAKRPQEVSWTETVAGRWVRELSIGLHCVRERTLQYDSEHIVRFIERYWEEASTNDPTAAAKASFSKDGSSYMVQEYSYAADGQLDRVTEGTYLPERAKPVMSGIKYQRRRKRESLDSLLDAAEELLVAEIPKTISAAGPKARFYALLLEFTGVDTDPNGFPPPLFLASEATRKRILAQYDGPERMYYLWSPVEWGLLPGTLHLSCQHKTLSEKLELVFQITIQQSKESNYAPVRKMFQRVCLRLNRQDWKGILNVTDDFVVFPVDSHGEFDMREDLKVSVPRERLQLLYDRKLLTGILRK